MENIKGGKNIRRRTLTRIFLFVSAIVLITLLFPKEYRFQYRFQEGKPWVYEDMIAPFDFTIEKTPEEFEEEKRQISGEVLPYFVYDSAVVSAKRIELISGIRNNDALGKDPLRYTSVALDVFDSIYSRGIILQDEYSAQKNPDQPVYVVHGAIAAETLISDFFSIHQAVKFIRSSLAAVPAAARGPLGRLLEKSLVQNVRYSKEFTYREKLNRIAGISTSKGLVLKNQRIISKGEIISHDRYQVLVSLKKQYEGSSRSSHGFLYVLLGQIILISLAMTMLGLFLLMFRHDIFNDNRKITLILSLIILMVLTTSILIRLYGFLYISIIPLCIVPLVIRTFFDTRLALFVHLITIIIIGFLVPDGFEFVFLQLIAGIVTIISNVNIEKRSQFFITTVYIFITYSLSYAGMNLIQNGTLDGINSTQFAYFAGSSVLTVIAFPVIVLYEKLFGYVTNVSLMEYSNTNNRLLRELSLKAPGTFQHSLQVSNLAGEAAHRIGANALLVRTGALYHDIGKTENPQFFTENQISGVNPHSGISLKDSAKIIIGHVERGLVIARKAGLPEQITDFIRTHHGTRRTEYFYLMHKNAFPGEGDDQAFTYPGPLPSSREAALVMMADAVEAASRSLKQPDRDAINDLVERIIDSQIAQRQFRNADISMRDISRVKSVFKYRLMNVYHLRIEYPKAEGPYA